MIDANHKIAVIGLGYVGLPLAVEFGKARETVGFDISASRIADLCKGIDATCEKTREELSEATLLEFTTDQEAIRDAKVYIVTVPTPVDQHKRPDLAPLLRASALVGEVLSSGNVVIFESTVYPGATEEDCVPVLEKVSGLSLNKDFFCGYSPERINPGDKNHKLPNITKVVSGSTAEATDAIASLYDEIITVGTFKAESIRVAEAAKVIENTQRDVNIALINELAIIFSKMGIDTKAVLEAAGTKWNFLPFRPGLVGGHCIGVDPYYMAHKAQFVGHHPEVILAGRRVNDFVGTWIAGELAKALTGRRTTEGVIKVLVLGLTFKEDCPDIRNTRVVDIIAELDKYGFEVSVADPHADSDAAKATYGLSLITPEPFGYDAVVVAVGHSKFLDENEWDVSRFAKRDAIVFDVKSIYDRSRGYIRL